MTEPEVFPFDENRSDDGSSVLWFEAVRNLPGPARRQLLDFVVDQSRQIAALSEEVERLRPPPSREQLLERRDAAIKEALAGYDGPPTKRAKGLEQDLRYAAALKSTPKSARLQAAAAILGLNDSEPIGWRQLQRIAYGYRR